MAPRKKQTLKQQNEALEKQKRDVLKEIVDLKHQIESRRMENVRDNPLQDIKRTVDLMYQQSASLSTKLQNDLIPLWQKQEDTKNELQNALEQQRGKRLALELEIDKQRHIGLCLCDWVNAEGESCVHSLPCGHLYCTDCINKQMDRSLFSCKQCKRPFERGQVWRVFYGEN